jgi:hypothetical protein
LPLAGGTITGSLTVTGSFTGGTLNLSVASTSSFVATNATSTNLFAVNASTTNATSTNLFATLGNFTTGIFNSLTATAATITNLIVTTITGTNATFTNATTTNATSTNLYAASAVIPTLSSTNATFTNLTATSYIGDARLGLSARGTYVYDDFDRSNQVLNGSVVPTGQTWMVTADPTAPQIVNGVVVNSNNDNYYAYLDYGSGIPRIEATFSLSTWSGDLAPLRTQSSVTVIADKDENNPLQDMLHLNAGPDGWTLMKRQGGGSFITIATGNLNLRTDGTVYRIGMEIGTSTNTVTVLAPDGTRTSVTDSAVSAINPRYGAIQSYDAGSSYLGTWHSFAMGDQNPPVDAIRAMGSGAAASDVAVLMGSGLTQQYFLTGTATTTGWYRVSLQGIQGSGAIVGTVRISASSQYASTYWQIKARGHTNSSSDLSLTQDYASTYSGNVISQAAISENSSSVALDLYFPGASSNPVTFSINFQGAFTPVDYPYAVTSQLASASTTLAVDTSHTVIANGIVSNTNLVPYPNSAKMPQTAAITSGGNILTANPLADGTQVYIGGGAVNGVYYNAFAGMGVGQNKVDSNNASSFLTFNTASYSTYIERMRIDPNGNVGIGTLGGSLSAKLVVNADNGDANSNLFLIASSTASATTTLFNVTNTGAATLAGTLTQNSDQRLKTNVQSLDASSSLAAIESLNPVSFNWMNGMFGSGNQLGFIAQQVQPIFPNLVSTTSATALTPDGTLGLNYIGLIAPIVKSIQTIASISGVFEQNLVAWLGSAGNGIHDLYATIFHGQELCLTDSGGGTQTCINQQQLAAILAATNQSTSQPSVTISTPTSPVVSTSTPPTISIQGDNPATIHVGDTYTDLGAIVTDNQGTSLGYKTFVNGVLESTIVIDTSTTTTDTIGYVATDTWGNISTSTRTVIVDAQ